MESDDIERFEEERELELYREYRDVLPMFTYVIETERRFYLANKVDIAHLDGGWVQVDLADAWVWDMFRPARFVASVRVMTRRDVNVEELARREEPTTIPDWAAAPPSSPASEGPQPQRERHARLDRPSRRFGLGKRRTLHVGAVARLSRGQLAGLQELGASCCRHRPLPNNDPAWVVPPGSEMRTALGNTLRT